MESASWSFCGCSSGEVLIKGNLDSKLELEGALR